MKKSIAFLIPLFAIFTAFKKTDFAKPFDPEKIDLESRLTLPATVVVESGCTASFISSVEINNPLANVSTATFSMGFYTVQKRLLFSVMEINDQPASSQSPFQFFTVEPGKTVRLKLKFQMSNRDFDFNKAYLVKGYIYPKRIRTDFSFIDENKTNDLLSQEVLIGSPNVLCYKCLETEVFTENADYGFFIPDIDYNAIGCGKALGYLSSTQGELIRTGADLSNSFFKLVPSGNIPNTSVRSYLVRNNNGKYLTYVNGVPKFTSFLQNDIHSYQKWVILKESKNSCHDKEYTLIQYLDGNNCKTLIFSRANGKEQLVYKNGIITTPHDNSEKIIIKARFETYPGKNN